MLAQPNVTRSASKYRPENWQKQGNRLKTGK